MRPYRSSTTLRQGLTPLRINPRPQIQLPNQGPAVVAGIVNWEIHDFVIVCDLGSGNFGSVMKGIHRTTGVRVAIKSLRDLSGFWQEAIMFSLCSGSIGVVQFFGVARDRNRNMMYIVVELGGTPLEDAIRAGHAHGRALSEDDVRVIMKSLLVGLKNMHKKGIIHRDLKPSNILNDSNGRRVEGKICDFGLAIYYDQAVATWSRTPRGTYGCMAPEVHKAKSSCTFECDMRSLGAVMYEVITGSPLIKGRDPVGMITCMRSLFGTLSNEASTSLEAADGPQADPKWATHGSLIRRQFSPQCLEVLHGLLKLDPSERLSAADALEMDWFASH